MKRTIKKVMAMAMVSCLSITMLAGCGGADTSASSKGAEGRYGMCLCTV